MFLPVKHRSINTDMKLRTLSTFPASAFPLLCLEEPHSQPLAAGARLHQGGLFGWLRSTSMEERRVEGGRLVK